MSATISNPWRERPPDRLEQRIAIERDGTIVVRSEDRLHTFPDLKDYDYTS